MLLTINFTFRWCSGLKTGIVLLIDPPRLAHKLSTTDTRLPRRRGCQCDVGGSRCRWGEQYPGGI